MDDSERPLNPLPEEIFSETHPAHPVAGCVWRSSGSEQSTLQPGPTVSLQRGRAAMDSGEPVPSVTSSRTRRRPGSEESGPSCRYWYARVCLGVVSAAGLISGLWTADSARDMTGCVQVRGYVRPPWSASRRTRHTKAGRSTQGQQRERFSSAVTPAEPPDRDPADHEPLASVIVS